MSWAKSLIKLSTYEVEILQKRLGESADRQMQSEMKLAFLEAEGEAGDHDRQHRAAPDGRDALAAPLQRRPGRQHRRVRGYYGIAPSYRHNRQSPFRFVWA